MTSEEKSTEQDDSSSEVEVSSRLQYSKILPLNCHIFMLYGSFAAVLPNTSVEADQLGIAPQLVGAMVAAVPLSTVLIAALLPHFRSRVATIKRTMILVAVGQTTCHLLALRVTRGHRRSADAPAGNCLVSDHRLLRCGDSYCVTVSKASHLAVLCDEQSTPPCRLRCHETRLVPGKPFTQSKADCLRSLSKGVVWGFLLLRLLAIVFSGVAVTLTDTVARLTHDEPPPFRASTNQHRLWGSAGWGAASLLMGQLNHWKSSDGGAFINFAPAVYLSTSMNALDLVAIMLLQMPLRETPSRRLYESEPSSYRKHRTYFYMALTYVVGSLSGAIWVFGPLRLRLLGAQLPLIAATSAVQVFGGELVHTFASERLIHLLGLRNAASASILSLFARLLTYGLVPLPWALLPVEAAQGLTVGLFSKATFALASGARHQDRDWHLQQVLCTIYHGIGACFGAFVAGCLIPVMEINRTFVLCSIVALVAFYVHFSFGYCCSTGDPADGGRRRPIIVKFLTRLSSTSGSSMST